MISLWRPLWTFVGKLNNNFVFCVTSTVIRIFMCDEFLGLCSRAFGMWIVVFIIQCSSSLLYFRKIAVRYFPEQPISSSTSPDQLSISILLCHVFCVHRLWQCLRSFLSKARERIIAYIGIYHLRTMWSSIHIFLVLLSYKCVLWPLRSQNIVFIHYLENKTF